MTTVAIISEYNPFHLGHAYQIEQIRKEFGQDTCIIALMSGNFVQRGTPAVFDKFARAKAAVQCGVNLVLEYPFPFCSSGANYFAKNAVHIISGLGVADYLSFGAETSNIDELSVAADALCSPFYEEQMGEMLKQADKNLGFAEIRDKVLQALCPSLSPSVYREPNNILAIEYLAALKKTGAKIKPHVVQRTVDHHAKETAENGTASASCIREMLTNHQINEALQFVPENASALYQTLYFDGFWVEQTFSFWGRILLSHLRLAQKQSNIFECSDELLNRIVNASNKATNYSDLIQFSKAAHFTKARLQRALLHNRIGTPSAVAKTRPAYVQLLAADEKGMGKLKQIHHSDRIQVLTKPADTYRLCPLAKQQADFCAKADSIYSLLWNTPGCGDEFLRKSPYCVR